MSNPAPLTMRANGTIRVNRFCRMDTADNNSCLEADANSKIIGISQDAGREAPIPSYTTDPPEAAVAGDTVGLRTIGDMCLLRAGTGGWTAGDYLESDADGNGVPATAVAQRNIGAWALESAAAGELGKVQIVIFQGDFNT